MNDLLSVAGWGLLIFSLLGVAYTMATGAAVGWFFSRPHATTTSFPGVTILKPLCGDEPGLRACLEGFCVQAYPGAIHIIFGVRDARDAAIPIVKALARDYPDLALDVVVDARLHGSNHKISNLINMAPFIRNPVVVLADSDIMVGPDYLQLLVAALAEPGVGFVSCVSVGRPTGNFWSRLSAMSIDYHFLPSVALGLRLGIAKPCFGPTIALSKATLDEIGGFAPFMNLLADDFEIGRAIRAIGYGFAIPPLAVGHGCPERSARSLFGHELRWARTIRVIDPLSYAGSAVCHPLPWAVAAVVMRHGDWMSLAAVALVVLSRAFVAGQVSQAAGGRLVAWWLLPARDLLSSTVWALAFFVKTVNWRGGRFKVSPSGVLITRPVIAHGPEREPALVAPAILPVGAVGRPDRDS